MPLNPEPLHPKDLSAKPFNPHRQGDAAASRAHWLRPVNGAWQKYQKRCLCFWGLGFKRLRLKGVELRGLGFKGSILKFTVDQFGACKTWVE